MKAIIAFAKKEAVFLISLVLALSSSIFLRPNAKQIFSSIDFRVLALLFCLMAVINAFREIGVLDSIANAMLKKCSSIRLFYFTLIFLVFFVSMLVTNDVALLTFVPLTLLACKKAHLPSLHLVILETIAANLGSSFTPMGNPQNLFLYSYYDMGLNQFFGETAKIAIPSIFILALAILILTKSMPKNIESLESTNEKKISKAKLLILTLLLVFILLTVFKLIDYKISFIVTVIVLLAINFKYLLVDFFLLATFVFFFIFTANISRVELISNFLSNVLSQKFVTYIAGIISSQVISNVPAALLLSGFTKNAAELLLGVNVGGLGTLIASLASVISYKLYSSFKNSEESSDTQIENCQKKHIKNNSSYMKTFILYNLVGLLLLIPIVWFL